MTTIFLTLGAVAMGAAVFWAGRLVERRKWNAFVSWWTGAELEVLESFVDDMKGIADGAQPVPPAEQYKRFLETTATANRRPA